MSDRIKLAEAMGWSNYLTKSKAEIWEHSEHSTRLECPDPFTDANDDYAVLEWMKRTFNTYEYITENPDKWVDFVAALDASGNGEGHTACYRIGDYARAALKVLDDKEDE